MQLEDQRVQDSEPQTVHPLSTQTYLHSSNIHSNSYLLVSLEGSEELGNCTGLDEVEQLLNLRLHRAPLAHIWFRPCFLPYHHNNALYVPFSDGNKRLLVKKRIRPHNLNSITKASGPSIFLK